MTFEMLKKATFIVAGAFLTRVTYVCCQEIVDDEQEALKFASTYKVCLNDEARRLLTESPYGMKTYQLKLSTRNHITGIVRIGSSEVNASKEEIESAWLNQGDRKNWDAQVCSHVEKVNSSTFRMIGFSKLFVIPAREFIYSMYKLPGASVDVPDYNASVLVQLDRNSRIPRSWLYIRGKQSSLLILEPMSSHRTKVTYFTVLEPSGLSSSVLGLVSLIVGDTPLSTLSNLKKFLEDKNRLSDDHHLSVEELARRKFQEKTNLEKRKEHDVISNLADKEISVYDIEATIRLLEKKLQNLRSEERSSNLDLSDLKHRIEADVKKARDQLQYHRPTKQ